MLSAVTPTDALAFGADEDAVATLRLLVSTSRRPFRASDGVLLNVECFGPVYRGDNEGGSGEGDDESANDVNASYTKANHRRSLHNADEWPLLLYVHGICESAETWGVQTISQYCAKHCWRLVVLELAGHGLSGDVGSGSGGLFGASGKGRATCPDFDELVHHVVEFAMHTSKVFSRAKGLALCGGSLGGALVAYAVKGILAARQEIESNLQLQSQQLPDFYGVVLLAPAFGIHPEALPPSPLILALRTLSHILPSQGILTPVEHPDYACPPSSARNYSGRWPLSTSNMLLDLTARRVPDDVKKNKVAAQMEGLASICVIIGDRDEIVPVQSVQDWYDSVTSLSSDDKTMTVLRGAGHGFFHDRSNGSGRKQNNNEFADRLFEWLNDHARKDFGSD